MISSLTPEQRGEVAYAFLERGVPTTAVADALGMDPEHVAAARSEMLVKRYGTDEKSEAMDFLIWKAYDEVLYQIENGTPANKTRFCAMVLSRSVGIAGKSTPETGEKIRQALDEMTRGIAPRVQLAESIYEQ